MSIPMWQVTVILDSTSTVMIEDLGIEITDSTAGYNLSASYTYDEIAGSDSLRGAVANGGVVINNGDSNLSAVEGVKYLTFIHQNYLENNYYDIVNLSTSGQSAVHWTILQICQR